MFLGELNDLIQAGAGLGEAAVTESLERMRRGAGQAPIAGFWLVAEHITGLIRPAPPCRATATANPQHTAQHEHLRELFATLPKLMVDFRAAVAKEAAEDRELTTVPPALIEEFQGVR